jgi:predicted enzyme related to lactoylglutathione lyase
VRHFAEVLMTPSHDLEPSVLQLPLAYSIIYVADLPAMARFYSEVLGLPIAEENARFVAFGGAAAPLALEAGGPAVSGPRAKDQNPTLFQFAVPDIATAVNTLAERGLMIEGEIRRGGFGALAFFRDPEGNRLALLERVPPPSQPPLLGGGTGATN